MNGRLKYRSPPPVYLNRSTWQHDGFKANLIAQYSFIRTSSYTSNEYRRYLKARKLGHSVSVSAFRGVHPQSAVFRGPSFIPAAILRSQKNTWHTSAIPQQMAGSSVCRPSQEEKGNRVCLLLCFSRTFPISFWPPDISTLFRDSRYPSELPQQRIQDACAYNSTHQFSHTGCKRSTSPRTQHNTRVNPHWPLVYIVWLEIRIPHSRV